MPLKYRYIPVGVIYTEMVMSYKWWRADIFTTDC